MIHIVTVARFADVGGPKGAATLERVRTPPYSGMHPARSLGQGGYHTHVMAKMVTC